MINKLITRVQTFPRWHALGVAALTSVMMTVALWPTPSQSVVVEIPATLELPPPTEVAATPEATTRTVEAEVQSGDTLSTLFERAGAGVSILYRMLADKDISASLDRIYPGQSFDFVFDGNDALQEVTFSESMLVKHRISVGDDGFDIQKIQLKPDIHTQYTEGTIESSLYMAGMNAGLSDNMIMQLATLFGWDIDFIMDIRKGDTFSLIYEEHYLNDKKLEDGPILAARFNTQGRTVTAIRYTDDSGRTDYYAPDGSSIRKAFLRAPLDVFRISSRFNLNRKHPILNKIRAHKGTDYAAPTGTPIHATGDGKVIFAGRQSGYGNVVIIQHGGGIRTKFAHMHGFAKKTHVGARVKQGQVIGYVGMTGLATGPHCHYEFLVNGVNKNPQTVDLPTARPLDSKYLPAYKEFAANMEGQLQVFDDAYVAAE